jgi:hypothetical protein
MERRVNGNQRLSPKKEENNESHLRKHADAALHDSGDLRRGSSAKVVLRTKQDGSAYRI